jgi:hypothetical protein
LAWDLKICLYTQVFYINLHHIKEKYLNRYKGLLSKHKTEFIWTNIVQMNPYISPMLKNMRLRQSQYKKGAKAGEISTAEALPLSNHRLPDSFFSLGAASAESGISLKIGA